MSLNIQTNYSMPQNTMAFKGAATAIKSAVYNKPYVSASNFAIMDKCFVIKEILKRTFKEGMYNIKSMFSNKLI